MRHILVHCVVLLTLMAAPAAAADLQTAAAKSGSPAPSSPWELAFSFTLATDYNFRGISQSDRGPSGWGYGELRYNVSPVWQIYAGIGADRIDFPNDARVEIDVFAGVRPKFGALSLDMGIWYYGYPGGNTFAGIPPSPATCATGFVTPTGFCNVVKADLSYFELFGKASYTVNDQLSLGANVFYSPNWLNAGTQGTYVSVTAKASAPKGWMPSNWDAYAAGELGGYFLGRTDAFYGVPAFPNGVRYADYMHWNVGFGLNYKNTTLDVRYYDTTLSRIECNIITSDHTATFNPGAVTPANPSGLTSNWCGPAVIAKLSFDITTRP